MVLTVHGLFKIVTFISPINMLRSFVISTAIFLLSSQIPWIEVSDKMNYKFPKFKFLYIH